MRRDFDDKATRGKVLSLFHRRGHLQGFAGALPASAADLCRADGA